MPCSVTTGRASRRSSRSWKATAVATAARSVCSVSTRFVEVVPTGTGSASCSSRRASRPSSPCTRRSSCTRSAYRRRRPVDEVIGLVGLDDKASARIHTLSGGQKRRLDLALGIVGRPEVLFLDEPTTGFDAAARRKSWELIEDLCRLGTTVLLTTHYLDEAEHLADRVGVLCRGTLVAEGTPAELTARQGDTVVAFTLVGAEPAEMAGVLPPNTSRNGQRVEFTSTDPTRRCPRRHRLGDRTRCAARRVDRVAPDARGRVPRSRRRPSRRSTADVPADERESTP